MLKGSVGPATYTTGKTTSGKKVQIVRQKPTDVTNPNTVAQILQRMKLAPVVRFIKAIQEILDHSYEGYPYGELSLRHARSLALKGIVPYMERFDNTVVPIKDMPISEGSINVSVNIRSNDDGLSELTGKETFDETLMNALSEIGIYEGDQLTRIVFFIAENGDVDWDYQRVIVTPDADATGLNDAQFVLYDATSGSSTRGDLFVSGANNTANCIIVSRKDSAGNWLRNTSYFAFGTEFEKFFGDVAKQAAIASYQEAASGRNAINSPWYLNQSSGQAFNGTVLPIAFDADGKNIDVSKTSTPKILSGVALIMGYEQVVNQGGVERVVTGYFKTSDGRIVYSDGTFGAETEEISISAEKLHLSPTAVWVDAYMTQYGAPVQTDHFTVE